MINQYKRRDVFRCSQEAHHGFEGRVSVFHVLKEKECYPQGCLYFLWHCVLKEKGARCIHGYRFVGKNCKGCTYFEEEKVHLQPTLLLDAEAYEAFQSELEDFETWLDGVRFRRVAVGGRIKGIKPWVEVRRERGTNRLRLMGYLLVFRRGFIGMTSFEDTFYVRVSEGVMRTHGFVPKMKLEMTGEVREDRGRIIIHRPRKIEIVKKGWGHPWTREQALVVVKTATLMNGQPDHCLACRWGVLADVTDVQDREEKRSRNLYCLKGISDPERCYVNASEALGKKESSV